MYEQTIKTFEELKKLIASKIVRNIPASNKKFIPITDTSSEVMRYIISQKTIKTK